MAPADQAGAKQASDLSRAFSEDGARKTHVGGQALLEGIMMRGKYNWAVAVRAADGSVYLEEHDLASGRPKNSWMNKPLIRGCRAMVESLALGFKALEVASSHAFDEFDMTYQAYREAGVDPSTATRAERARAAEVELEESDKPAAPAPEGAEAASPAEPPAPESESVGEGGLGKVAMTLSMVGGVALAVALFMAAPLFLTNLLVGEIDSSPTVGGVPLLWNVVNGALRVVIFVLYLWLIGRMKDIKRMYGYHGAEHKTIHCFEHGLELTPENARQFPCLHVRCGTAFLIMVLIIAILVYTVIPINPLLASLGVPAGLPKSLMVLGIHLLFLPVIAGVSYEITVRWAGSHPESPLVKVILWPGMQMQYLTTSEPDDEQLECAIAAMKLVLEREEREAAAAEAAEAAAAKGAEPAA
ncbi:MAG: DUF1385 domain-containing protein [Coriobacteriia bacterium]|nr:DUF1385 domain-containing protein [Coriobacteriia bacterium]